MPNKWIAAGVVLCGMSFLAGINSYGDANKGNENSVVFKVGNFDRSSFEFADGQPEAAGKFYRRSERPGKGLVRNASCGAERRRRAGKRRCRVCAQSDSLFGGRRPERDYELRVSLLIETASVPALRISINGRHGLLYLHPKLDYSNGDQGDSFYPASSHAETTFEFPAGYLKQGENTITFQAVEQADDAVPDASLTYDAIELDRVTGADHPIASSAEIVPTIFFHQEAGSTKETVDVFLRSAKAIRDRHRRGVDDRRQNVPPERAGEGGPRRTEAGFPGF